jgi:nucleoside 2-deoxyribosyltransferase
MNIYFACSITGGRSEESFYKVIVDTLLSGGHIVPTAHLSGSDVMMLEEIVDPSEVYSRDTNWIDNCQALVAEVSTPSHGVGYEISYALYQGKPVLCLYKQGVRVSKMITGNNSTGIRVSSYQNSDDIVTTINEFLTEVDPDSTGFSYHE